MSNTFRPKDVTWVYEITWDQPEGHRIGIDRSGKGLRVIIEDWSTWADDEGEDYTERAYRASPEFMPHEGWTAACLEVDKISRSMAESIPGATMTPMS